MTCSEYFPGGGQYPVLLTLSPSAGTNLRSLRLVGNRLNFLAHPNGSLAQAIRQLPSLQHLHMSRCLAFYTAAFFVLPASLRCLFLSEYGEWGPWSDGGRSRHAFVVALSKCVAQAAGVIKMVAIYGVTGEGLENQVMGDLSPLQSVCSDRNIPFHLNICSNIDWPTGEIRILCKSLLSIILP
jgi:hypothetical protein